MARHANNITTIQARTIVSAIESYCGKLATRCDIESATENIIANLEKTFPVQFPATDEKLFYAFSLSACAKEGIKRNELNVLDYIAMLADIKESNESAETSYNGQADYGAFGDLLEILVRCAFMRNISLVQWSMLSVKDIKTADIISKKFGIVEVGHNGKSFTFGTLFDYMAGEYTSIVYGVFDKENKKEIYEYCKQKQYAKAIDYVCSYCGYWSDKYAFQADMDGLTRGKGITVKGENIQVVYNSGKYNAFLEGLESGKIKSLAEVLG